jgi:ribosome-associated protein
MNKARPTSGINKKEIYFDFIRSSGPGGQNVNKVSTAVQLRFDLKHSSSINPEIRKRLFHIAGKRISSAGILIISSDRFRTQERNRRDVLFRLDELINKASKMPKKRKKSTPTTASIKNRIVSKVHRGSIKQLRRTRHSMDD